MILTVADALVTPPAECLRVSLIVCTRNRARRLPSFLDCVARLQPPPGGWELILVDNASTDDTAAVLRTFVESAVVPARLAHAPVPGLARARNVGLALSTGDVIAFTDDDCYPSPDYLCALSEIFVEHQPGFVGGRVIPHNPTDARIAIRDSPMATVIVANTFVRPGLVHGANMAVRRSVVGAIGGFDPHLGAGTPCQSGEDIEFLARAAWGGWEGRYDPRTVVAHDHGRRSDAEIDTHRQSYDYGRGAYYLACLLRPASRWTYVARWFGRARRHRHGRGGRLWRELKGAFYYAHSRIAHTERVPRFDWAAGV